MLAPGVDVPGRSEIAAANISKFTEVAGAYGKGVPRPEIAALLELAGDVAGLLLLDAAAGKGACALEFAARGARVQIADITLPMLAAGRPDFQGRAVPFRAVGADAHLLPFSGGAFDAVSCTRAYHHLADVPLALREARRVLKRGGLLLVADHSGPDDPHAIAFFNEMEKLRDSSHTRFYSPAEWAALVKDAGFRLRELRAVYVPQDLNAMLQTAGPAGEAVWNKIASAPPALLKSLQIDLSGPPVIVRLEAVFAAVAE